MHTLFHTLTLLFALAVGVTGIQAHAYVDRQAGESVSAYADTTCPSGSDRAQSMVENFLTNPNLADARQETGTTSLSVDQIQSVSDPDVCQQLNDEFSASIDGYNLAYFKIGDFYFASQILKQSENTNEVVVGLSFIYILDGNLNFIKGYSG
ncbi:MAG: hypothetical protein R6U20_11820 [Longimonas sp.]|uniref:hypothetical protein n=1 Tax=Longimonas sp. TaxID=2039626 RepID=UPI00397632CE